VREQRGEAAGQRDHRGAIGNPTHAHRVRVVDGVQEERETGEAEAERARRKASKDARDDQQQQPVPGEALHVHEHWRFGPKLMIEPKRERAQRPEKGQARFRVGPPGEHARFDHLLNLRGGFSKCVGIPRGALRPRCGQAVAKCDSVESVVEDQSGHERWCTEHQRGSDDHPNSVALYQKGAQAQNARAQCTCPPRARGCELATATNACVQGKPVAIANQARSRRWCLHRSLSQHTRWSRMHRPHAGSSLVSSLLMSRRAGSVIARNEKPH
jgi:hypothetical protein